MTVLLVEDDTVVRLTLAELLEDAGFDVLEASDAEDAWALIADPARHINILVTDLNLGSGDNGLILATNARSHLPKLQIVYATGSPEVFSGHTLSQWERVFFKPFDPAALVAALSGLSGTDRAQYPPEVQWTERPPPVPAHADAA